MLSDRMIEKLNEQINLEFFSSNLYLQMGAWCEYKAFEGCAAFMKKHAAEEMTHMQRLWEYVNETGALARIGTIEAPQEDFSNIKEVFEVTLAHEETITKAINSLADIAFQEKDYSTFNFLQWYVAEQHEEEKLFKSILDKIDMIGLEHQGLFFIDQEVGKLVNETPTSIMDTP